jgi:hypothetical protein
MCLINVQLLSEFNQHSEKSPLRVANWGRYKNQLSTKYPLTYILCNLSVNTVLIGTFKLSDIKQPDDVKN